jgi:hypothetical protein
MDDVSQRDEEARTNKKKKHNVPEQLHHIPKFDQLALPRRRRYHNTPKPIFEAERCTQII